MAPKPEIIRENYKGSEKLLGKTALITGGDSGIGRSVAVHFAREGADVAIIYLNEDEDAIDTQNRVRDEGRECLLLSGDVRNESFCRQAVNETISRFGQLDVLVNNAAVQFPKDNLEEILSDQFRETFETNMYAYFYFAHEAVKHMEKGSSIINTTSINAFKGSGHLVDYAATKGAIMAFTRSLAQQLTERGIRVNAVAPGPIWTPLIPASFDAEKVAQHGSSAEMERAGQPNEVAPSFVFLASPEASYISGQVLHPNGGVILNA